MALAVILRKPGKMGRGTAGGDGGLKALGMLESMGTAGCKINLVWESWFTLRQEFSPFRDGLKKPTHV